MIADNHTPTRDDLMMKAHIELRHENGQPLVTIKLDEVFPDTLDHTDPGGIEDRVGIIVYGRIISPILAAIRNYVQELRPTQPANSSYQRIDQCFPHLSRLSWLEEPVEMDRELRHLIDQLEADRLNRELEAD